MTAPPAPDPDRFYTPPEIARLFGVHGDTPSRWARNGKLPAHAIVRTPGNHIRFRAAIIDALRDGQPVGPCAHCGNTAGEFRRDSGAAVCADDYACRARSWQDGDQS